MKLSSPPAGKISGGALFIGHVRRGSRLHSAHLARSGRRSDARSTAREEMWLRELQHGSGAARSRCGPEISQEQLQSALPGNSEMFFARITLWRFHRLPRNRLGDLTPKMPFIAVWQWPLLSQALIVLQPLDKGSVQLLVHKTPIALTFSNVRKILSAHDDPPI